MSNLRDKMAKHVESINNTISNDDERSKVLNDIQKILQDFTSYVVLLNEKQTELQGKVDELAEIVLDLEDELHEGFDSSFTVCPYCGEEIPILSNENDNSFECPVCHNIVEMTYENDETENCELPTDMHSKIVHRDNVIDISFFGEANKKTTKDPKKKKK